MRLALFFLLGILFWAGTASINYGNRPPNNTPKILSCAKNSAGATLLNFLHMGRIAGIRDNGQILTIGLTPEWLTLSSDIQYDTYEAVVCYARAQQRAYQIIQTP